MVRIGRDARRRLAVAVVVVAGLAGGCGPTSVGSNYSPTSESDPARHEQAIKSTEAKAKSDQDAERKAFQKLKRAAPNP
jgi:hypothetical protein